MKVAVIPARGGSKRIPRKNIVDFCGRPMIAWTIDAARECGLFDRVIVSTEDTEIAEVALAAGAEVPFLRKTLYDDLTPVSNVTIQVLRELKSTANQTFETVVQLMANCPLRTGKDIARSYENFRANGANFQLSCCEFGWLNPWWACTLDSRYVPAPLFPDALKQRSQDLPKLFCPSGAVWMANAEALLEAGSFYGAGYTFFPLEWRAAIDIDDMHDLELARAINATRSGGVPHGRE